MDRKLLNCLVCPQTGGSLQWIESKSELWCFSSGLAYPVDSGIPVMIIDKARLLTSEEINQRNPLGE